MVDTHAPISEQPQIEQPWSIDIKITGNGTFWLS